jgi:hypothetical protein
MRDTNRLRSCAAARILCVYGAILAASWLPLPRAFGQQPENLSTKRPLDAEDLAEKREGFYLTALPLAGYSPDGGLGLGARGYGYWNGDHNSPFFRYAPYRHRVYVQAYASLLGVHADTIAWDAPYLSNTEYRARATLAFNRWAILNYFGSGESTLSDRAIPTGSAVMSDFVYYTALAAIRPNGTTFAHYAQYGLTLPNLNISIERDFAGGALRALAGVIISYGLPVDDTGRLVDGVDSAGSTRRAVERPIHVRKDCAAGAVQGCQGGWANALKLGIAFDTRDFEPDPLRRIRRRNGGDRDAGARRQLDL